MVETDQVAELTSRAESLGQTGRASFLQRLVHNRQALVSLVAAGHVDTLLSLLRSESDAARRGSYLGALWGSSEVTGSLAAQEKLKEVVELIESEDTTARQSILQRVIVNRNTLNIWVQSGVLDPLIELVEDEGDPRLKADLLGRIATNEIVLEQWEKEQRLALVLAIADSFGRDAAAGDARRNYVSRLFSHSKVVQKLINNDLYDPLLQLATREPEPTPARVCCNCWCGIRRRRFIWSRRTDCQSCSRLPGTNRPSRFGELI